jgi:hypothetical protein
MQINETKLNQVIEIAKQKTTDARWIRAIDKAAAKLQSGELFVTLLSDDTAVVTSENGSYRVNGHCQCKAAQNGDSKCYHRAAKRLTEMMEAAPAASAPVDERSRIIEHIERAWFVRYTSQGWAYRLSDSLLRYFGTTDANEVPVDYLRRMLVAIA